MNESMADFTESLAKFLMWIFVILLTITGLIVMTEEEGIGFMIIFAGVPITIFSFGILSIIISIRRNIIELEKTMSKLVQIQNKK